MPFSDPSVVDPEEMFVASLASCHVLWFSSIAEAAGFRVDSYRDAAEGRTATVTPRPHCHFSGERLPSGDEFRELHDRAHHECFLASSVRSQIRLDPMMTI